MITVVAIIISAFAALMSAGAVITSSLHQKAVQQDANDIDRFEAITAAHEKRISSLEKELTIVKKSLVAEQQDHRKTQAALHVAVRYIRELITWARAQGLTDMPAPPPELEPEL